MLGVDEVMHPSLMAVPGEAMFKVWDREIIPKSPIQTSSLPPSDENTNADGNTYHGKYENDKRNGQGVAKYADGTTYSGAWVNDQKHGIGTETYPNGMKYVGNFEADQRVGQA